MDIDGKSEDVIIKDRTASSCKITCVAYGFLARQQELPSCRLECHLHFINEEACIGVKLSGGLIAHSMTELEIMCLPKDLPEYLEVDMAEVDLGPDSAHL